MKSAVIAVVAGLAGLCAAWEPELTPPKHPFTPFFHLQVAWTNNHSIEHWWVHTEDYGDYLHLSPNYTDASIFYQSANYTNNEHRDGGSVLVHNVTDAVPNSVPGTPYTPRNLIAGQSNALEEAGTPPSAESIFTKSQQEWDDIGYNELNFHIGLFDDSTHFETVQTEPVEGWTDVSACWFNFAGYVSDRLILTNSYPAECSKIRLRWVFAAF